MADTDSTSSGLNDAEKGAIIAAAGAAVPALIELLSYLGKLVAGKFVDPEVIKKAEDDARITTRNVIDLLGASHYAARADAEDELGKV